MGQTDGVQADIESDTVTMQHDAVSIEAQLAADLISLENV
jgi:hypothetical protein